MTLQTFFVILSGYLIGGKAAFISMLLYLCLGLMGIPVFTEGGGIGYVLKPSFGFILGFCLGAFITGVVSKQRSDSFIRLFLSGCAGLFGVYCVGLFYFGLISNMMLGFSLRDIFLFCFLLPLPGDILSCFLAAILAKRILPIIRKQHLFSKK